MSTELFLFLCKKVELNRLDLEDMTIGMCLDYVDEYIEQSDTKSTKRSRKATQSDFDSF